MRHSKEAAARPENCQDFATEDQFVAWLRRRAPVRGPVIGIGDDTAVATFRPGCRLLLTTDLSIEGVHFDFSRDPADSIGHRALARSLSDIAAMGGAPRFALVSVGLSPRVSRRWLERFYDGLFALARRYRVRVVGGDTARTSGKMLADVMVAGEAPKGTVLLRSGAQKGDRLYVAGELGMAELGLRLLRSSAHPDRRALRAHLYPEPQCELGRYLAARKLASAAMDLSDGLSTDLNRLCTASGVGARVFAGQIPCARSRDALALSRATALSLALHGGEDYKLLFTVRPNKVPQLPAAFRRVPLVEIGEVTTRRALVLVSANGAEQPLVSGGYDHFRGRR